MDEELSLGGGDVLKEVDERVAAHV
jgi:hypothetical protein